MNARTVENDARFARLWNDGVSLREIKRRMRVGSTRTVTATTARLSLPPRVRETGPARGRSHMRRLSVQTLHELQQ
jgi:hypothetical protein